MNIRDTQDGSAIPFALEIDGRFSGWLSVEATKALFGQCPAPGESVEIELPVRAKGETVESQRDHWRKESRDNQEEAAHWKENFAALESERDRLKEQLAEERRIYKEMTDRIGISPTRPAPGRLEIAATIMSNAFVPGVGQVNLMTPESSLERAAALILAAQGGPDAKRKAKPMPRPKCDWCGEPMIMEKMADWWDVSCMNLDCPVMPQMSTCKYETRKAAISAWNTRAPGGKP
jgi:hypothetical protein